MEDGNAANGTPGGGAGDAADHNVATAQENKTSGDQRPIGVDDTKIFVGGTSADTDNTVLHSYFSQFGPIKNVNIKYDPFTGRSRGFGFVEFVDIESCKKAMVEPNPTINNKKCELKIARSDEGKKVFVGSLPQDITEESVRTHFQKYGPIEAIEWPRDRRYFVFVIFQSESGAEQAVKAGPAMLGGRSCDVRWAAAKRPGGGMWMDTYGGSFRGRGAFAGPMAARGGPMGAVGGYYGRGGGRPFGMGGHGGGWPTQSGYLYGGPQAGYGGGAPWYGNSGNDWYSSYAQQPYGGGGQYYGQSNAGGWPTAADFPNPNPSAGGGGAGGGAAAQMAAAGAPGQQSQQTQGQGVMPQHTRGAQAAAQGQAAGQDYWSSSQWPQAQSSGTYWSSSGMTSFQ